MSVSDARLRLTDKARRDIVNILAWGCRVWGPSDAEVFGRMIFDDLIAVGANPEFGLFPDHDSQRIGYWGAGRHIIIYQVDDKSVAILRVLHYREMLAEVVIDMN